MKYSSIIYIEKPFICEVCKCCVIFVRWVLKKILLKICVSIYISFKVCILVNIFVPLLFVNFCFVRSLYIYEIKFDWSLQNYFIFKSTYILIIKALRKFKALVCEFKWNFNVLFKNLSNISASVASALRKICFKKSQENI